VSEEFGVFEERARVICHLPCEGSRQVQAVRRVFSYLKGCRTAPVPVVGFTHSEILPTTFRGLWFGKRAEDSPTARRRWIPDKIVVLILDYETDFSDERLQRVVDDLANKLREVYTAVGSQQSDFWIIAERVFRYA
jgi:hypothetical protein